MLMCACVIVLIKSTCIPIPLHDHYYKNKLLLELLSLDFFIQFLGRIYKN